MKEYCQRFLNRNIENKEVFMSAAVAAAEPSIDIIQNLAADFRQFVANLGHPQLGDKAWTQGVQRRCHELSERFDQLRETLSSFRQTKESTFNDLRNTLASLAEELAEASSRRKMKEIQSRLVQKYEDFVAQMKTLHFWDTHVQPRFRSLRLPQAKRSIFHVCSGIVGVILYQFIFSRQAILTILFSMLAILLVLEVSRRFSPRFNDFLVYRFFGAIARPQERYQTNSASYYALALTIIVLLTPQEAACLAVLVLAFGDPSASVIGHRFGKIRLANDKSLEGSLGFFAAAWIVSSLYLLLVVATLPWYLSLAAAASVALVGAVIELYSNKLDDNFTVPIACALTGFLWF